MLNTINQIREKQSDFFSLELGMHYSISMMVEKYKVTRYDQKFFVAGFLMGIVPYIIHMKF